MKEKIKAWAVITNIRPNQYEFAGVYFTRKAAAANKEELKTNWDMSDAKVIAVEIHFDI